MAGLIDETGKVYNEWTVLRKATDDETLGMSAGTYWLCRCSCGTIKPVLGKTLRSGKSKSCGHANNKLADETGKKYGEWTVLRAANANETQYMAKHMAFWICQCSCGKVSIVSGYDLRHGNSKSCGHDKNAMIDETGKKYGAWTVLGRASEEDTILISDVRQYWNCRCECGRIRAVSGRDLRLGISTNCGCKKNYNRKLDELRNDKQKELVRNASTLKEELIKFKQEYGRLPNTADIKSILGVSDTTQALYYIKNRGLLDYIDIGQKSRSNLEIAFEQSLNIKDIDNVVLNCRSKVPGYEIDLLFENSKLAVEINGDYWHSELFKDKQYHANKTKSIRKAGYDSIMVYEYELEDEHKAFLIKNVILSRIGKLEHETIAARNCELKLIDSKDAQEFGNKYHMQGGMSCSINIALLYKNKIVSVMQFDRPRFNSNCTYELIRYITRYDYWIIGGAERLLAEFRRSYKGSIVSYCDIDKFSGNVYKKLGFEFVEFTAPSYVWRNLSRKTTLSRYSCTKYKLVAKGLGTEEQTEVEIMQSLGFVRIFNSGCATYILKQQ